YAGTITHSVVSLRFRSECDPCGGKSCGMGFAHSSGNLACNAIGLACLPAHFSVTISLQVLEPWRNRGAVTLSPKLPLLRPRYVSAGRTIGPMEFAAGRSA